MAGMMALLSLGVIRMVLAPAAIMFSIAVTWPALSPSVLPAPDSSLAPLALAAASAPSFIFTKNGLVSVLVIRPITTGLDCAMALLANRAAAHSAAGVSFCMVVSWIWVGTAAAPALMTGCNCGPYGLINQVD